MDHVLYVHMYVKLYLLTLALSTKWLVSTRGVKQLKKKESRKIFTKILLIYVTDLDKQTLAT